MKIRTTPVKKITVTMGLYTWIGKALPPIVFDNPPAVLSMVDTAMLTIMKNAPMAIDTVPFTTPTSL